METSEHAGDWAAAIEELYRENGPRLLGYFLARHGRRDCAEDLLQATFAAVMREPARLLNATSSRGYLYGIARNLSLTAYRLASPMEELPADLPAVPQVESDPRLTAMREAITRLDGPLREVIEFRLEQELSYQEIADALDLPVGTVRSRLHHAVSRLRKDLARRAAKESFL